MSDTDPTVIRCEGSHCPTHDYGHALGTCKMCGQVVTTEDDGRAHTHNRQDVLATLTRGDGSASPIPPHHH